MIKASSLGHGNIQAQKIKQLSVNQKLVLVCLVLMDQKYKDIDMTHAKLSHYYFIVSRDEKNQCPVVTRSEFDDLVMLLDGQVMILN